MKKQTRDIVYVPYSANPVIDVTFELPFGKDLIKAGDKIRIKNDRTTYTVQHFAYHGVSEKMWVDCTSDKGGSFHSFYIDRISRVIRPKKKRKKKNVG
jgi:hypothetical protein